MAWAEADIPDLTGKTVLVTGANSGVGYHAARLFAQNNATVILACRSIEKMAAAAAALKKEAPSASFVQMQLDVSDLDSVRAFADELNESDIEMIDILLLNAGAAIVNYETSKQGYEMTFATNHLGHWLLTGLLLPYMQHVPGSRIVVVSSVAHEHAQDIDYQVARGKAPEKYSVLNAYPESKLANQWFVRMLQERLTAARAQTIALPCHPGASVTNLFRHASDRWWSFLLCWLLRQFSQPAEHGAWPLVMASTEPHAIHGNYYGPRDRNGHWGVPVANAKQSDAVFDDAKARELWRFSEELTWFSYDI